MTFLCSQWEGDHNLINKKNKLPNDAHEAINEQLLASLKISDKSNEEEKKDGRKMTETHSVRPK